MLIYGHLRFGYREVQAKVLTETFGTAMYLYVLEWEMSIARCEAFEDGCFLKPPFYFDPHRDHDSHFWGMAPDVSNQGDWLRHLKLAHQCFVGWGGVKRFRTLAYTTHYFRVSDGRMVPYTVAMTLR